MMMGLAEAWCQMHFIFLSLNGVSQFYHLSCSLNLVPKGFYCCPNSDLFYRQQWCTTTDNVLKTFCRFQKECTQGEVLSSTGKKYVASPWTSQGHGSWCFIFGGVCLCLFMLVCINLRCHSSGTKVSSRLLFYVRQTLLLAWNSP